MAWLVAVPVLAFTLMLEWGLARDFAQGDVRQYLLAVPAALLVALAALLTLSAAGLRRWAVAGAVSGALVVGAAVFAAVQWGESVREENIAAACSVEDVDVLSSLPMYLRAGGEPQGYADGGCYLRYSVQGDVGEATELLTAEMVADGWSVRSGAPTGEPSIFVRDGVELYADVEGLMNLEDVETTEGITVFRLTVFFPEEVPR